MVISVRAVKYLARPQPQYARGIVYAQREQESVIDRQDLTVLIQHGYPPAKDLQDSIQQKAVSYCAEGSVQLLWPGTFGGGKIGDGARSLLLILLGAGHLWVLLDYAEQHIGEPGITSERTIPFTVSETSIVSPCHLGRKMER